MKTELTLPQELVDQIAEKAHRLQSPVQSTQNLALSMNLAEICKTVDKDIRENPDKYFGERREVEDYAE